MTSQPDPDTFPAAAKPEGEAGNEYESDIAASASVSAQFLTELIRGDDSARDLQILKTGSGDVPGIQGIEMMALKGTLGDMYRAHLQPEHYQKFEETLTALVAARLDERRKTNPLYIQPLKFVTDYGLSTTTNSSGEQRWAADNDLIEEAAFETAKTDDEDSYDENRYTALIKLVPDKMVIDIPTGGTVHAYVGGSLVDVSAV